MRKIISKIDYMIQEMDLTAREYLWSRIKDKSFIINEAKTIVKTEDGKDTFFAPSIVYMSILNKKDLNEKTYQAIVKTILENSDISRTIIYDDMTFLDIILNYDKETINQNYFKNAKEELINRRYLTNFNYIKYIDVVESSSIIKCSLGDFEVGISEEELKNYEKFAQFSVAEGEDAYQITNYLNLEDEKINLDDQDELTKILTINKLFRKNNKHNR